MSYNFDEKYSYGNHWKTSIRILARIPNEQTETSDKTIDGLFEYFEYWYNK